MFVISASCSIQLKCNVFLISGVRPYGSRIEVLTPLPTMGISIETDSLSPWQAPGDSVADPHTLTQHTGGGGKNMAKPDNIFMCREQITKCSFLSRPTEREKQKRKIS